MITRNSPNLEHEPSLKGRVEKLEKLLAQREFVLSQTQKLAKTGSWDFDRLTQKTMWSDEMYNIHELSRDFDPNNFESILDLYEGNSRILILDAVQCLFESEKPFDIVARIVTPLGYRKWVRVVAHPMVRDGSVAGIVGITSDITTAKESEELIRESEEKFSSAFRNSPDLMVITREHDLRIMDVNENVSAVLGYTRQELVGKRSSEFKFFANTEDRQAFFDSYHRKQSVELECPWLKKNGERVHVLISGNRLQLRDTNYFITVIKDISARRLAEEKFQKVFHLSPDMMLLVRVDDLTVVEANRKVKEVCGLDYPDIIGQSTSDLDVWVSHQERDTFLQTLRSTGQASTVTLLRRKNSQAFYGSITSNMINLNGEAHFVCVIRDITDYVEAENKIRQNEINLNAIINNTDMDIWSVDEELRIVAVNDNFKNNVKRLYDVDLEIGTEMISSFRDRLHEDKFAMWLNLYNLALGGGSVSVTDNRDDQILNYALQPIKEGEEVLGVVGYAKNVTDLFRKELQLEVADKRIAELQLTTLRAFMNPHFIFNALNSIQYFISKSERENAIEYLSTFSALIRKVLISSQNDCISLEDELHLLSDYVAIERLRFDEPFDYIVTMDESVAPAHVKLPSLLIQPFLENAINHGFSSLKRKGKITVDIVQDKLSLLITVQDNGIGRSAAELLRSSRIHESSGVAITTERIRLINKNNQVSIEYEDLQEGGVASGTKVFIRVQVAECSGSLK